MLPGDSAAVKKKIKRLGHPVTGTDVVPVINFLFFSNCADYSDGKHS
jgi:hypothetical protein